MEVKDGVLDLTPKTEEQTITEKLRPGAETVAFEAGFIDKTQIGNPFHGLRALPGQYLYTMNPTDDPKDEYVRDMVHVINFMRSRKYTQKF